MWLLFVFNILVSCNCKVLKNAENEGVGEWARFIWKYSTNVDRMTFNNENFVLHLKAIKDNLGRVTWGRSIPENLVYHYVIPPRVSQEPLENFTWIYRDSLYELVKDCKNISEAILKINEWCFTRIEYRPTEPWDQSAMATLRRGFGRCEEMTILFMKALRTVGIPVRYVYTPWWPFTESNHAWVEVWTGSGWSALGSAEPTDFNFAWFRGPTKRAGLILSVVFGNVADSFDYVQKKFCNYTILNLTEHYTNTFILKIEVKDAGKKVKDAVVSFNVWNYSAFVPIWIDSLKGGEGVFKFGKTDILVYAKRGDKRAFAFVKPRDDTIVVSLSLLDKGFQDTFFWFRTAPAPEDTEKPAYVPRIDTLLGVRSTVFSKLEFPHGELVTDTLLREIFLGSKGNWQRLLKFYNDCDTLLREKFKIFLSKYELKDIAMMDTVLLRDELQFFDSSITYSSAPPILVDSFIAPQRIHREELSFYRRVLYPGLYKLLKRRDQSSVEAFMNWTQGNFKRITKREFFKPFQSPLHTFQLKEGTVDEIYVFIVAALRTFGIPARLKFTYDGVEYWLGSWKEFCFESELPSESKIIPVHIRFLTNGKNVTPEMNYYYNFSIQRFANSPERIDLEPILEDSICTVYLEEGHYSLMYGFRNAYGDVFVKSKSFDVTEFYPCNIDFDISIPVSDIGPRDLVVRNFNPESLSFFGENIPLSHGNILILYVDLTSEGSRSSVNSAVEALQIFPGKIIVVTDEIQSAEEYLAQYRINGEIWEAEDDLKNILKVTRTPAFILIMDKQVVLYVEGPVLNLESLIKHFIR